MIKCINCLLTVISGDSRTFVYSSAGVTAILPCANVLSHYPNCSSTTWIYDKDGNASAEEVVTHGITRKANRLSLLSNCSLRITDVITEDAGVYTCRQYPNGTKHGKDAVVHHLVLHSKCDLPKQWIRV